MAQFKLITGAIAYGDNLHGTPAKISLQPSGVTKYNRGSLRGNNKWKYPTINPGRQPGNSNLTNLSANISLKRPTHMPTYNKGALKGSWNWKYPQIRPYTAQKADAATGVKTLEDAMRDPRTYAEYAAAMGKILPADAFWPTASANLTRYIVLKNMDG